MIKSHALRNVLPYFSVDTFIEVRCSDDSEHSAYRAILWNDGVVDILMEPRTVVVLIINYHFDGESPR